MIEKSDLAVARRKQILDATFKVVSVKGYQNMGIADIAAELGIGHGTVYRYFKNKLDIVNCIIDEVITRVTRVVLDLPAGESNSLEEYREQLLLIGNGLVNLIDEEPELASFLHYENLGLPLEVTAKVDVAFDLFAAYTQAYLKNGVEKGFLRQDINTWETALALNAILFEAAKRILKSTEPREIVKEVWFQTVIGLMLDGLGSRPGP
jgi:AcrR family transcriptional regulator